ncbi:MAG: YheV family putative metal-binding protein [Gammaproteobacteria bacterium]|nr:YheV family putative metal-binding protein [Gammaproteobacteria bacterium]
MKKRFIAGAQCPQCQQYDVVTLNEVNGQPHMECVDCGYQEDLATNDEATPASNKKAEQMIQWVNIDSD